MKIKPRLKGVSDVSRKPAPPMRLRPYQQDALDARYPRLAADGSINPPTKSAPAVEPAKPKVVVRYEFGDEDGRHWIEVVGKRCFCDEIDLAAARAMVADVQAAGQKLTPDEVKAAIVQLVETGRFWSNHEAKQKARLEAASDPVKAKAAGIGYAGPAMPDKGKQDGSCNRSACQMPLAGKPQFFMRDYMTENGRLHYCADCAALFDADDRRFGDPRRCTELTPENRA